MELVFMVIGILFVAGFILWLIKTGIKMLMWGVILFLTGGIVLFVIYYALKGFFM